MIFRFRICRDPDMPDLAAGWIEAPNELSALDALGRGAQVYRQRGCVWPGRPGENLFLTNGAL